MTFVYINNMQFFVNKMYQQYDGDINYRGHLSSPVRTWSPPGLV